MPEAKQQEHRVTFDNVIPVQIMAIDGTWRRPCILKEVSEAGATLDMESSVQGLNLTEFFLLLSSTGLAYRRCELERINGDQMSVNFLRRRKHNRAEKEPSEFA